MSTLPKNHARKEQSENMEVIIGLAIGVILGGAAAWFAARMRAGERLSALRSEMALAQERLAASESANAQTREDADEWQRQADEGREEVSRLKEQEAAIRAELENAQERITESQSANSQTREEAEAWRSQAIAGKESVSRLEEQVAALQRGKTESDQAGDEFRAEAKSWRDKAAASEGENARLQADLKAANRQLAERTDIEKTLLADFQVMASDAISSNSESFLSAANEKVGGIVKPLSDELKRIETARNESQGSLKQQIEDLVGNNKSLEQTTRDLKQALTRPQARGRWGEIQLRRVAELAGMIDHCDFREQVDIPGEGGASDRPDMVVYMPSERTIVVDAKTPLRAYLESIEADSDEQREAMLERHARQVRERASSLTQKAYWNALERSPEFVVMFLPGEFFLQPALERDPDLFDRAMRGGVVIATPNTLMALLKTVEMGWQEARIADEARAIADLGSELHDRLAVYSEHIVKMGSSLNSAVTHYNSAVGSFDGRVSVSARRFKELGVSASREIADMKTIDVQVRDSAADLEIPQTSPLALTAADADGD